MKLGIMQPYFFPYIGYWQLINAVDRYVIFDDVNYIKRGWINRNNILYRGESRRINLHIKNASQNRLINDTYIAQTKDDNIALLAVIKEAYMKAPCFEQIYYLLDKIINFPERNLAKYLRNQIEIICEYLDIKTQICCSSEIDKNNSLKGEEKIIEICRNIGADYYINAIGGRKLYHQDKFRNCGIKLRFIKNLSEPYAQYGGEFLPDLSIIDVMMFNDNAKIKEMLEAIQLTK